MFESVTQPGNHIGAPPTGRITSTEAKQWIDASLFKILRIVSVCDKYMYFDVDIRSRNNTSGSIIIVYNVHIHWCINYGHNS